MYAFCKPYINSKLSLNNVPHFHISIAADISPFCDCHGENDAPILPNLGIFASFDPVAIDQACADMCCEATPLPNTILAEHLGDRRCACDAFTAVSPDTDWRVTLSHAEKIGIGTREYELIRVK